jgi:hypothetical protein
VNKKLTLILAGALAALAFMALTGSAAAKETKLKCEGEGKCTFTTTSSVVQISLDGGDTIKCEASSGSGEVVNLNAERESATDTVQLLYTGCKEQSTIFHFACSNTETSGNITSNVMTTHYIALPKTPTEADVLKTNFGITFTCVGGHASTQITGSVIGESETKCGENTSTVQKILTRTNGDGLLADTSYTGATFKLEAKTSHTGAGSYVNAAIDGTTTLTFNQNVILTCA